MNYKDTNINDCGDTRPVESLVVQKKMKRNLVDVHPSRKKGWRPGRRRFPI